LGETGVGKDVRAQEIHARSARANGPLVRLNCAALGEALLESELFGHEKGAFTGATASKPGLIETAHGGTLFLDEVGEMPLATQAKLLRVVEHKEVRRLGGLEDRRVDVRLIAATNRNLAQMVEDGSFRRDLYFRLNGITIELPPLRERASEIAELAARFASKTPITPAAIERLRAYAWPGNVRELRNVIERAAVLSGVATIGPEHLVFDAAPPPSRASDLTSELASVERKRIEEALAASAGNQTKAAELLGITRRALINRLNEYGFARPRRDKSRS
jgi:transcriptional regulator with PAS, ATPase and Fis domain